MIVIIDNEPHELPQANTVKTRIPSGFVRVWDRDGVDAARDSVRRAVDAHTNRLVNPMLYTALKGGSWRQGGRSATKNQTAFSRRNPRAKTNVVTQVELTIEEES